MRRPHCCFTYTLRRSPSSYRDVCATCTALSLHTHPVDRGCHIAAFYAVAAAIMPRRFVLPIRRRGSVVRFDRSVVTMMICPSEGYVIRRRVGTYCRSASRLRRAICAANVLHAIRRATDLSLRPRIAPLPQPAHLARRLPTSKPLAAWLKILSRRPALSRLSHV